ncbi:hypothetical protein [Galbibacter sp. BG1]|uniref:hypothetical protein n=1 Tax=Galbibacter sp. BG1 TaxID=1170699 RepID=UPI002106FD91|nr:hypothetical protein [Galbibacter sp. BG1]
MKFLVTIFLLIICLGSTFAQQGDLQNTPIKLEGLNAVEQPKENAPESTSLDIKTVPDINIPEAPKTPTTKDLANKEVNMMDKNEAFLDPGDHFEKKLNRELTGKEDTRVGATSTQYFGDFKSNAKSVKILCRDHQYVDGDRVSVIVNDKVVVPNIFLESSFKGFYIDLEQGFNKIEFKALNQGTSGPNTAQFAVFDDKGVEISSNIWNLSTGVKASLLIIKE